MLRNNKGHIMVLILFTIIVASLAMPKALSPVLLSINYQGESAGVYGPGEFGDFGLYTWNGYYATMDVVVLEFWSQEEPFHFMMYAKAEKPFVIGLEVYNIETKVSKFYKYPDGKRPVEITYEEYTEMISLAISPPSVET